MTASPITTDMSIPEIVKNHPATQAVFEKYGIHTDYKALEFESVLASAKVNQVDVDQLLTELNAAASVSAQ